MKKIAVILFCVFYMPFVSRAADNILLSLKKVPQSDFTKMTDAEKAFAYGFDESIWPILLDNGSLALIRSDLGRLDLFGKDGNLIKIYSFPQVDMSMSATFGYSNGEEIFIFDWSLDGSAYYWDGDTNSPVGFVNIENTDFVPVRVGDKIVINHSSENETMIFKFSKGSKFYFSDDSFLPTNSGIAKIVVTDGINQYAYNFNLGSINSECAWAVLNGNEQYCAINILINDPNISAEGATQKVFKHNGYKQKVMVNTRSGETLFSGDLLDYNVNSALVNNFFEVVEERKLIGKIEFNKIFSGVR